MNYSSPKKLKSSANDQTKQQQGWTIVPQNLKSSGIDQAKQQQGWTIVPEKEKDQKKSLNFSYKITVLKKTQIFRKWPLKNIQLLQEF